MALPVHGRSLRRFIISSMLLRMKLLLSLLLILERCNAFSDVRQYSKLRFNRIYCLSAEKTTEVMGYEDADSASKGVVSSLTDAVNWLSSAINGSKGIDTSAAENNLKVQPPQSAQELMERIREDYIDRNYLWTGDIDLACFDADCRFTDPTLSFEGRDTFVNNISNLRPVVDRLIRPGECQSDLLDITLQKEYIETRWNMIGELNNLPWKPKIDVIGRTKFWYNQTDQNDGLQVYFYDEAWEMPAGKALLQLITPANTIRGQS